MKNNEKKTKATEETKPEENNTQLTDEELAQVSGGKEDATGPKATDTQKCESGLTGSK